MFSKVTASGPYSDPEESSLAFTTHLRSISDMPPSFHLRESHSSSPISAVFWLKFCISNLQYTCLTPCPSHPLIFDPHNYTYLWLPAIQLASMQLLFPLLPLLRLLSVKLQLHVRENLSLRPHFRVKCHCFKLRKLLKQDFSATRHGGASGVGGEKKV